jgi:hypothetical protein
MALSLAGGHARTRLYEVGTNPGPAIEVPAEIDAQQLAVALNAVRRGEVAEAGEIDAFHLLMATARENGFKAGQRSLVGVS